MFWKLTSTTPHMGAFRRVSGGSSGGLAWFIIVWMSEIATKSNNTGAFQPSLVFPF